MPTPFLGLLATREGIEEFAAQRNEQRPRHNPTTNEPKDLWMDASAPRKSGVGRPAFVPTDEQRELVRVLVANGISHRVCGEVIGVSNKTFAHAFRHELAGGYERVKAAIGASLVKQAMSGNVSAIKFWLLTRAGDEWKLPKGAEAAVLDGLFGEDRAETVHIYMPPNHRDEPEPDDDGPIIEGEVEEAA
jgi:hypothetical protein